MALERLTQITEVGIQSGITLRNVNVEGAYVSGVVTATTLNVTGGGANFAGVVTATSFSGNVTGNITPTGLVVSGVSTFQSSSFWGDGDIAYFGDGQDLLIWHNSTDSIIRDNGTGDLNIEGGNRIKLMNPTGIETYAVFNQDGASELWYDNAKKFETTGAGVTAYGSISVGSNFIGNNAVGLGQTTTTGRNAGVGTATGTIVYNTITETVEVYTGNTNGWLPIRETGRLNATGGIITLANGKIIHTFTGSGSFTVTSAPPSATVEYLVVAGGGGGGVDAFNPSRFGSGGGAGGFRTGSGLPVSPGVYTVTVGAGGGAGTTTTLDVMGKQGNPSIFSTITSTGGGGGAGHNPGPSGPIGAPGTPGGSGGGGPTSFNAGNTPPTSPPQGNPGGISDAFSGSGGGGAGQAGFNAPSTGTGNPGPSQPGAGGNGTASSISGTSVTYAGGGGGAPQNASGGTGGGGPGNGTSGTTNTGGGGGANRLAIGGSGGSGIVIISYPS